jgi:hypothetical protein
MRRLLTLSFLISSLAFACAAAGLTAPAAFAAGSTSTAATTTPATTTPGFGLSNAEQNAVTPTTNNVAPATTTSGSGGLSGADAVIIGIVGVGVLFGIAFFVWRDARGHAARVGHGTDSESMFGKRAHAGSKAPPKARKLTAAERKRRKRGRAR